MENIQEEIKASIEKNLPKQVSDVLRKRLEKADEDEASLASANELIAQQRKTIEDYRQKESKLNSLESFSATLDEREKNLNERERNLDVQKLSYELAAEKDKTQFTKKLALRLVRNTTYRKDAFSSQPILKNDPYNTGCSIVEYHNNNNNETTTAQ